MNSNDDFYPDNNITFVNSIIYSFQKYNLELKGWNKLFTTESNIPSSGKLTVIFKFYEKMEMSKNEIIFLNKHFIQRSNNNNVILNKVTEEKLLFVIILIRMVMIDF